MTPSLFKSSFRLNRRCLAGALLLSALVMGSKAQAEDVNFYIAETSVSGTTTNLANYEFDTATGTATLVGTYTPTGVFGGTSALESTLSLSEDGTQLSYAGFTTSTDTSSKEVLFTLPTGTSTGTFDSVSTTTGGTVRSSYYGTNTGGTSGFFLATGNAAPRFIAKGGTTASQISGDPSTFSANTITYNAGNNNLYLTKNSTSVGGVYTAATNGLGLFTSTTGTFVALTGTTTSTGNWNSSHLYTGMGFLGTSNLFVADTSVNTIDVFTAVDPTMTNDWNLAFQLPLQTNEAVEQISVDQIDANNALIFFTTNGGLTGTLTAGTSTFEEVSYNTSTGFGTTINTLGSSASEYFTGIVAIPEAVPEPSTDAMIGIGLGLMGLILLRKKTRKGSYIE